MTNKSKSTWKQRLKRKITKHGAWVTAADRKIYNPSLKKPKLLKDGKWGIIKKA